MTIEGLATHYPVKDMDEAAARQWASDWVEDLSEYPADIIRAAATQWRRGGERYMPTPGRFRKLADPILSFRKRLHTRAVEYSKIKTKEAAA